MGDLIQFPVSLRMPSEASSLAKQGFSAARHLVTISYQILNPSPALQGRNAMPESLGTVNRSYREELQAAFGEKAWQELLSLEPEQDPELYFAALMRIAGDLEKDPKTEATAHLLYRNVELSAGIPNQIQLARRRRQVLEGGGSAGDKSERALRQLGKEVGDLRNLGGLFAGAMVGSALYNISRFRIGRILAGALERRAQTVGIHPIEVVKMRFQTRGLALLSASLGASMMDRGLRHMTGMEVRWDLRSVTRDTAMAMMDLTAWRMSVGFSDLYRMRAISLATPKNMAWKEVESFAFTQTLATLGVGLSLLGRKKWSERGPENPSATTAQWLSLLLGMNVGRGMGRRAVVAFN